MNNPKVMAVAIAFLGLQSLCIAVPETYSIDPAHSTIGFKVKHLFSNVTGRFDKVEGVLTVDSDKPETSSVKVTIPVESIDTANDKRDSHLRSPDFFNAKEKPDMTFVSKKVTPTGSDTADVLGDLTLHGVTKEVPLKVHFLGKGKGMMGETRSGWEATASIKRSDFGLTWNKIIEGTAVVGDVVDINLQVEAVQK